MAGLVELGGLVDWSNIGALSAIAAFLGAVLSAVGIHQILTALLQRRTGKETVAVTASTAELQELTKRLLADLDIVKAAQVVYQAVAEERARLVDSIRAELSSANEREASAMAREAAAATREAASIAREAICQERLVRADTRMDGLFHEQKRLLRQLRAAGIHVDGDYEHEAPDPGSG